MARKNNAVDAAYHRLAVLKAIVSAERERAESKPYDNRNLKLGIIEPDQPKRNVAASISTLFNELELFLNHLSVLHLAASFETEAKARLGAVVGTARAAIEGSREHSDRWAANLVRSVDSFEGLRQIGEVLGLTASEANAYNMIKDIRNNFSHGKPLKTVPQITAEDTRDMLVKALDRIK